MLRSFIYVTVVSVFAVSCSSSRRLADPETTKETKPSSLQSSAFFGKRVYKGIQSVGGNNLERMTALYPYLNFSGNVEKTNELQFKYAVLTDVPVEALTNMNLLNYMEDWYGTPYHYGGNTKKGIDCSAFTKGLMESVYNEGIPRTVREQYESTEHIDLYELHEGDLVFFNTRRRISHVGIYLFNNKFIHASSSRGVMISDLADPYFQKRFVGAGRWKQNR